MDFSNWRYEITTHIEQILDDHLPSEILGEVIRYSVLPTGKLFRPLLVYSLANDLDEVTENHQSFACSLELHHTYTLIHDDLPAMDDDDYRRGRLSSHKKFNEWKAILAGDGLLNLSYQLLAEIDSPHLPHILKDYAQFMGPKGLILGQALDLNHNIESFKAVLRVHELKTARLIQLAFRGANYLCEKPLSLQTCDELGLSLGICFQLLDDLCELSEEVSEHEKEINPFLKFDFNTVTQQLIFHIQTVKNIGEKNQLATTLKYIDEYFQKILTHLENQQGEIEERIGHSIKSVIEALTIKA